MCHNNGAIPAYLLSTKVLGVSEKIPLSSKIIEIKPMLGNLMEAEGTVVTVHGTVQVKWEKQSDGLSFSFDIPERTQAQVILPYNQTLKNLFVNNRKLAFKIVKDKIVFTIKENVSMGTYQ